MSNNIAPHSRFSIVDLESGSNYELRLTAHNNAGSTQAEYSFSTLSHKGTKIYDGSSMEVEETPLYLDPQVLAPSVVSILAVILAVAGVCFCLRTRKSVVSGQLRPDD